MLDEENPELRVRWNTVAGATGYKLRYRNECYDTPRIHPSLYGISYQITPMACSPATSFHNEEVSVTSSDDEDTSNDTFTYKIDENLDLGKTYRVEIQAVFSDGETSRWSDPIIGHVSDERPSHLMTFPLHAHWNPPTSTSAPVYEYVLCNVSQTSNHVPAITSKQARQIREALQSWQTATTFSGFWKDGANELIKVREVQGTCGLNGDLLADNPSLNEIKVFDDRLNQQAENPVCAEVRNVLPHACAKAGNHTIVLDKLTRVTNLDIFIGNHLSTEVDAETGCSQLFNISLHESGHALGIYGDPFYSLERYQSYGHSNVVPSVMNFDVSEIGKHCAPTYYDISALVAAYQGRFTKE